MANNPHYYQHHASDFFSSTVDVDMSALYQQFVPLLPPQAKVLDAGCGSGRDALYFKRCGFDVVAMDASEALAQLASAHLGQPVVVSTFQQMDWISEFDGIWCCASLLHVPMNELEAVFNKLTLALNAGGILYVSFKYGEDEREHNGRIFTDMNETFFSDIVNSEPRLGILNTWTTTDQRPNRENEKWFNAILKKSGT